LMGSETRPSDLSLLPIRSFPAYHMGNHCQPDDARRPAARASSSTYRLPSNAR
jgi:hypothetical protein